MYTYILYRTYVQKKEKVSYVSKVSTLYRGNHDRRFVVSIATISVLVQCSFAQIPTGFYCLKLTCVCLTLNFLSVPYAWTSM